MAGAYHEDDISAAVRDEHRALASLQEELEAVDWYNQRAEATDDEELKSVLVHNRDEEIEHAAMLLEWLRRKKPEFDEQLKTYLFTKLPITEVEEAAEAGEAEGAEESKDGSLGIGSVK